MVELLDAEGRVLDTVRSYFGMRNGRRSGRPIPAQREPPPHPRGALAGVLARLAPGGAQPWMRCGPEVQLIQDLGFTTARIHQKIEDPRFLYWADRLGLMVWTELPSAYVFGEQTTARLTAEWLEVVRRDRSHPSVVAWVPINESWGVDRIAGDEQQRHFVQSLYHLTKSLDPSRIVISNDGLGAHRDRTCSLCTTTRTTPLCSRAATADSDAAQASLTGIGLSRRRTFAGAGGLRRPDRAQRVRRRERGQRRRIGATASCPRWEAFEAQLAALFGAVRASDGLAGWCFTQLTDTAQETNGLVDERRVPKVPLGRLREIVTGGS